jgi:hypothetical protein
MIQPSANSDGHGSYSQRRTEKIYVLIYSGHISRFMWLMMSIALLKKVKRLQS